MACAETKSSIALGISAVMVRYYGEGSVIPAVVVKTIENLGKSAVTVKSWTVLIRVALQTITIQRKAPCVAMVSSYLTPQAFPVAELRATCSAHTFAAMVSFLREQTETLAVEIAIIFTDTINAVVQET